MDVAEVLALFLARLAAGYSLCLAVIGPRVDRGPWRKVSLFVIAGVAVVAGVAGAPLPAALATAATALLAERALVFGLRGHPECWLAPFGTWLAIAAENGAGTAPGADTLLGALAAGGALAAMLLGHGYLIARGLGFKPFRDLVGLLFLVLVARALSIAPVFLAGERIALMDWVFLSMRLVLGLGLPLLLTWMAYQCVRIESNQSATGILYAVAVLVGVFGELVAIHLKLARGIVA